jgi:Dyp-type peroxidase family
MIRSRSRELDLHDMQGNVLQGYGLPFAAYLFVHVETPAAGCGLLRELADQTTNAEVWQEDKPELTVNVALTANGLHALGLPDRLIASFPPEFRQGMTARAVTVLGDTGASHPTRWERGLGDGTAHLLVMLNARSRAGLDERLQLLRRMISSSPGLTAGHEQRAELLPFGREHFGFSDGFAQPSIEGGPVKARPGEGVPQRGGWRPIRAGEFVLGYVGEDDCLPPAPVIPYGRNGTFMVYRKLFQDVGRFREAVSVAARAGWSGDEELVAAKIVGRWRDGTPLSLSPSSPQPAIAQCKSRTNDFRYGKDPHGEICPLGAHIRRANPRDGLFGGGDRVRRHRIIRRGMPYGPPLPEWSAGDAVDRGLIFICFNASIARQFEVVNRWLLDGDHLGIGAERDFLLGVNEEQPGRMTIQGAPPRFLSPLRPLVITRGGEYLFLPGITGLRALAAAGGA